jgi:hypothetical protein
MTSDYPERDHGYGKPPDVEGVPTIVSVNEGLPPCPNCGCERTFTVRVVLKEGPPQLRVPEGSEIIGLYPGCAACPWAGPMMMTALPPTKT